MSIEGRPLTPQLGAEVFGYKGEGSLASQNQTADLGELGAVLGTEKNLATLDLVVAYWFVVNPAGRS